MWITERLELKSYKECDVDFLHSMLSDPEMMTYIGNGKTKTETEAREFLNWIHTHEESDPDLGLKVLVEQKSGERIGHAGLVPQQVDGKKEVEIGYWITNEFQGRGYAKEAADFLLSYGRKHRKEERYISLIQPGNTASAHIARSIGMHKSKRMLMKEGDVDVYMITIK
ncbi:GNAT family N-acetyltransferase [Halobacillus kuroshimensis]|uniref:GNAT family N-acetyltransferase n=1 Tax=Halobacillus kuroshimensis TaxID=302481 RepID=A0ABS3DRD7_9BACI|nr:GNAT family N-acetyltransferase [Halobacillus kuroshimensis]MBN8233871.1 GNAT family N-acetyltransferase [Halobacillus kuroshimensis]